METNQDIYKYQSLISNDIQNVEMQSLEKMEYCSNNNKIDTTETQIEKNKNCTYYIIGDTQFIQQMYICGRCDIYEPIPMCQSCFEVCHKECNSKEANVNQTFLIKPQQNKNTNLKYRSNLNSTAFKSVQQKNDEKICYIQEQSNAIKGCKKFSCLCGKIYKHQRVETRIEENKKFKEKYCNLQTDFLYSINPAQRSYFCNDCKISVCNLCAIGCHLFHNITENDNNTDLCKCKNSNHSLNDFLFDIYLNEKSSPVFYPALLNSKTKIINMMLLSNNIFLNMFDIIKTNLNSASSQLFDMKNKLKDSESLKPKYETADYKHTEELIFTKLISKSKIDDRKRTFFQISSIFFNSIYNNDDKCYYYNKDLKQTFSYEISHLFIESICEFEFHKKYHKILQNFVGIIFYLHIKADFQRVKNFSISDFMGSSISARIKHKKKYFNMKTNIAEINKEFYEEDNFTNDISLKFLEKYFSEATSISKLSIRLSKILKDILPKLNIFESPTLYEVFLRFINFVLKKMIFTKEELKFLIENLYDFFNDFYLSLISVNNQNEICGYIETTKSIFFYMIKISYLIAINYNDIITQELVCIYKQVQNPLDITNRKLSFIHSSEEFGDKLLKIILKTSFLFSESYKYDLQIDRKIINIFNETLKIFGFSENSYLSNINQLKEESIIVETTENYTNQTIYTLSGNLYSKIESIMVENHSDILNGDRKIYLGFDNILRDLLNCLLEIESNTHKDVFLKTHTNFNEKEKKIFSYKLKIFAFFSKYLAHSEDEFETKYGILLNSSKYSNYLISGSFDEIVSKYFSLFEIRCLEVLDVNASLCLYLLYCLNEQSIEYLCTGKNLSAITKIFTIQNNNSLILCDEIKAEFLYLIIKGIKLYQIDISNHKCILNLIEISEEKSTLYEKMPDKVIQRILKIFTYLENYLEFEEFEKIQSSFLNSLIKLISPSEFKKNVDEYLKEKEKFDEFNTLKLEKYKTDPLLGITKEQKYFDTNDINIEENSKLVDVFKEFKYTASRQFFSKRLSEIILESKINSKIKKGDSMKFYFTLIRFLAINKYYILNDFQEQLNNLEKIHRFVDMEYMKDIMNKNLLPLNYRTSILRFLRTFYFIDILDTNSNIGKMNHMTNEEMIKFLTVKDLDPKEYEIYEKKKIWIDKIISVMNIFVNELEEINNIIKKEKFHPKDVKAYLVEIVYSIKIISDFVYYQKSILSSVIYNLSKIGRRFIKKAEIIKEILQAINSTGEFKDVIFEEDNFKEFDKKNNLFKKEELYNMISNSLIDILKATNVDKNFKLQKYLKIYDKIIKDDFSHSHAFGKNEYEEFYDQSDNRIRSRILTSKVTINENKKEEDTNDPKESLKSFIRNEYKSPYAKLYDTCLLRVMNTFNTKDEIVDYRKNILMYFINYISADPENKNFFMKISNKIYTEETTKILFIITVKLLYYDTEKTQNVLEVLNHSYTDPIDDKTNENNYDLCKMFFKSYLNKLQKTFVLNFSTSLNFFMFDRYLEISELNKLMINFAQLLAEGFNSNFKSKILDLQITENESISIFDFMYTQLKTAYNFIDLKSNIDNNNELSHYKLIVLFSCIIDFFIEYVEGNNINTSGKITNMLKNLLDDQIFKSILIRIEEENSNILPEKINLCKKLLLRVKTKILNLLIAFLGNGVEESFLKNIIKELPMIRIFEEIQYHLSELILRRNKQTKLLYSMTNNRNELYDTDLNHLYLVDEKFKNSLELNLCLKLFIFLSILSDVYDIKTIDDHFGCVKGTDNKIENSKMIDPSKIQRSDNYISFLSNNSFKVYKFMKNLVKKIEVKNFEEEKIYKTFFPKPPMAFNLSNLTMRLFTENVDRDSRFSKLSSLIKHTDYFMFEMIYYSHFTNQAKKINFFLDLYYLEIINYLMIILQQIFLLCEFYFSKKLGNEVNRVELFKERNFVVNNLTLTVIQIVYICGIMILWFFFQFPLKLFRSIMNDETFLFRKHEEERRNIINKFMETMETYKNKGVLKHMSFVKNVIKYKGFWRSFRATIFDSLIMNRTINIFFFTFIINLLYIFSGFHLIIVFPVLFIINIIPILYGMFVALKTKVNQLLTMIMFTYIFVYVYMWIGYYFLYDMFEYSDIYKKGEVNIYF